MTGMLKTKCLLEDSVEGEYAAVACKHRGMKPSVSWKTYGNDSPKPDNWRLWLEQSFFFVKNNVVQIEGGH